MAFGSWGFILLLHRRRRTLLLLKRHQLGVMGWQYDVPIPLQLDLPIGSAALFRVPQKFYEVIRRLDIGRSKIVPQLFDVLFELSVTASRSLRQLVKRHSSMSLLL